MSYERSLGANETFPKITAALWLTVVILTVSLACQAALSSDLAAAQGPLIAPSGRAFSDRAEVVKPGQIAALVGRPSRGPAGPINRPTIPLYEYNAAKAAAASAGGASSPVGPTAIPPLAPAFTTNFTGAADTPPPAGENGDSLVPPDVDAAVGRSQILQPTNSNIDIWSKTGVHLRSINYNGFVGNFTDTLGDGRAVFDPVYNRWVVSFADFTNLTGSGLPVYYLAVSQTSDATGAFFVFPSSLAVPAGEFVDFPQLGLDQDALLVTANMFNNNSGAFLGPIAFAIPKAQVYNGLGYNVKLFSVSPTICAFCTLAPPFVEDNNGIDFFVAAPITSGVTAIKKFTMTEAGRSNVAFTGPVPITVASYSVPPPDANQTCTGSNSQLQIDTLDGRFQNRGYQYGPLLWQTHTISNGARPVPVFYEFNTTSNTVVQRGTFDLSSTSFDFNPHIAANISSSAIVTWTATDPTVGKDALVMFGGRTTSTATGAMPVGPAIAGSTSCLVSDCDPAFGNQRWGDYSAVNLDPAAFGTFWVTNENIAGKSSSPPPLCGSTSGTDHWSTYFGKVTP